MKVYQNITELIGRTPLLELKNYTAKEAYKARIFAKLEYFNPAGSVKDRIAYADYRFGEIGKDYKTSWYPSDCR